MIHAQLSSTESISHPFRLDVRRVVDSESMMMRSKQKFVRYRELQGEISLFADEVQVEPKGQISQGRDRKREIKMERDRESCISRQFSELQGWRHRLDIIRFNSLNFAKIANLLRWALPSSSFVFARRLLWISSLSSFARSLSLFPGFIDHGVHWSFPLFVWIHYTKFVLLAS